MQYILSQEEYNKLVDTSIVARHEIEQCAVRNCVDLLKRFQGRSQDLLRSSLSASMSDAYNMKISIIADCIDELGEAYGVRT